MGFLQSMSFAIPLAFLLFDSVSYLELISSRSPKALRDKGVTSLSSPPTVSHSFKC